MNNNKRCCDCKYFTFFRNYNYETSTSDTITMYCELLQNENVYDRETGDEISNNVFDDCPLKTGYVPIESAIKLLESKEEVYEEFQEYVRISHKNIKGDKYEI